MNHFNKPSIPVLFSFISLLFVLLFSSCSIEPAPIIYGEDACSYCSMNIIDKQHAAEYVTTKGKSYKFDAIECMVNKLKEEDKNDIAIMLVTDYANPGVLTDANKATYLISKGIKSPMGAFLTAFEEDSQAIDNQEDKGGEIYRWDDLEQQIKAE